MQKLNINLVEKSKRIPLVVGRDLLAEIGLFLESNFSSHSIYMVTDTNLAEIYKETIVKKLDKTVGLKETMVFPAGEASKSRRQKGELEDRLLSLKAGRDTLLIAFGGGVVGDLTGYLAATLMRGIPLIHVPTSLLAQVDSSIGGKVGIDHPAGKNLIGAFYQPEAIFSDIGFLRTLPGEEFANGMAEVIKYAVIMDDELWDWLEQQLDDIVDQNPAVLEKIITRCAELKIKIVQDDEKEAGLRSLLNFGHTAGHALEQASQYSLKHGSAVAEGMRIAARLSHALLGYPAERVERLDALLDTYGLKKLDRADFPFDLLWEFMLTDKKSRQQHPRFTLMKAPGIPELFFEVSQKDLETVFAE